MTRVLLISADRTTPAGIAQNVGDSVLTDALAGGLTRRGAEVRILDVARDVPPALQRPHRFYGEGVVGLLRSIARADLVAIGGGTLLQDDQREGRMLRGLPRTVAMVVLLARMTQTPVACIGVGCEVIDRPAPRRLLAVALRGVPVWVRDTDSAAAFERNFSWAPRLSADAILLEPAVEAPSTPSSSGGTLICALEPGQARRLTVELVRSWRERYDRVVFASMDRGPETDADALAADVRAAFDDVLVTQSAEDVRTAIAAASGVVASRMHALYIAALHGIPAIALGSKAKVASFAHEFGLSVADVTDIDFGSLHPADAAAVQQARTRIESAADAVLSLARR